MNTTPELYCDVLIIGSGAAGLSLALRLAEHQSVIVLSKGPMSEGSTFYAGAELPPCLMKQTALRHVEDTLIAGAGIVDEHAAEFVASNARHCVQWLIDRGVLFDTQVQPNGEELPPYPRRRTAIAGSCMLQMPPVKRWKPPGQQGAQPS